MIVNRTKLYRVHLEPILLRLRIELISTIICGILRAV